METVFSYYIQPIWSKNRPAQAKGHVLPPLTAAKKAELLELAKGLLQESRNGRADLVTTAEEVLLKTFCQPNLLNQGGQDDLTSYDFCLNFSNRPLLKAAKPIGTSAFWKCIYLVGPQPLLL
jgi:hypothetical protein